MQYLLIILTLIYILSPIDLAPGIPVDDLLAAIGAVIYLWNQKKKPRADEEDK